ncbi:MAG: hypothetical protein AB1410_03965 [Acidobacteriota bacterium]
MRKSQLIFLSIFLFSGTLLLPQEEKKEKEAFSNKKSPYIEEFIYNPEGRRDPFKNLLNVQVSQEAERPENLSGQAALLVSEVTLIGISKYKGEYWAIVNAPDGFPYFLKKGDKLFDGYVFSIDETSITFRIEEKKSGSKIKHRDVIKKLHQEED